MRRQKVSRCRGTGARPTTGTTSPNGNVTSAAGRTSRTASGGAAARRGWGAGRTSSTSSATGWRGAGDDNRGASLIPGVTRLASGGFRKFPGALPYTPLWHTGFAFANGGDNFAGTALLIPCPSGPEKTAGK